MNMGLLLDTCTLLWLVSDQTRLSSKALKEITKYTSSLYVSAITAFEIGQKSQKKLLQLPMNANEWYKKALSHHGIREITISGDIAIRATHLPAIHKDPADRMIIATALINHLLIITPDKHLQQYSESSCIW